MRDLLNRHRDVIAYLFFGVCTTMVNILVYWLASRLLHMGTVPASVVAWVCAVLFAYLTNRKWVFHSVATGRSEILSEISRFFLARLATGVFDWAFMYVTTEKLRWHDLVMKAVANIVVIVLNYVFSKFLIFKRETKE